MGNNLHRTYAYINNIVVAGKTQEEHNKKFLEVAKLHNLPMKKKKSPPLSTTSINFYTMSHGTLKTDADRLHPLK